MKVKIPDNMISTMPFKSYMYKCLHGLSSKAVNPRNISAGFRFYHLHNLIALKGHLVHLAQKWTLNNNIFHFILYMAYFSSTFRYFMILNNNISK